MDHADLYSRIQDLEWQIRRLEGMNEDQISHSHYLASQIENLEDINSDLKTTIYDQQQEINYLETILESKV